MSFNNNNSRGGRGGGGGGGGNNNNNNRNRRMPSSGSMSGSWRSGALPGDAASTKPSAPSTPAPAPTPSPAPASTPSSSNAAPTNAGSSNANANNSNANGGANNVKSRSRANSHRKAPSRKGSVSSAPPLPPAIAVSPPQSGPSVLAATPATPNQPSKPGNAGNSRGRRKNSSATLAPISGAGPSSSLAPIASAPPGALGFGSRTDIDLMVKNARASVLGHDGKHDWAQEDDDTLPDLDDWDVDNKSTASGVTSSSVLVVKTLPTSITTAPANAPGFASQQRAAKDRLDGPENKKSRRGSKAKNKAETSPVSPQAPPQQHPILRPTVQPPATTLAPPKPVPSPVPIIPTVNPTTQPIHPLAATPAAARRVGVQSVAVQLPKSGTASTAPLLPSPVFATLNPPIPTIRPISSKEPLQYSAASKFTREERPTTKPPSPVDSSKRADGVVKLPPSTPQKPATSLPQNMHQRTPSSQNNSPRQRPGNNLPNGRQSPAKGHTRAPSTTRPKISVSALFQLNRSIAGNNPPASTPARNAGASPAVAVE